MTADPSGVQSRLAIGHSMRKGFDGLAVPVLETLKRNPHSGHLFVFRGRRGGPPEPAHGATQPTSRPFGVPPLSP